MLSEFELQIFTLPSEKMVGPVMQSGIAKSDGINPI